jgi:hypothetical protein
VPPGFANKTILAPFTGRKMVFIFLIGNGLATIYNKLPMQQISGSVFSVDKSSRKRAAPVLTTEI